MSYPFADQPSPGLLPPLRIHHFMLWTAVSAVMMTVLKTNHEVNMFSQSMQAWDIPNLLLSSTCLTGLILGLWWKRQGHFFFDEPGQMAFILTGISSIYMLIQSSITSWFTYDDLVLGEYQWIQIALGIGWLAILVVQLALYFRFARKFSHFEKWSRFFFALGIINLFQTIGSFLISFIMVFSMGPSVSVRSMFIGQITLPLLLGIIEIIYWLAAVKQDWREDTQYHWTHWLGAATWPVFRIAAFITMALSLFFFSAEWLNA